jgi:hypothetical protein
MFALDAASRAVLAAGAFAAFGAAFVTTPMVARGEAAAVADPTPFITRLHARTALADVVPRRDPFAGGDTPAARPNAASPQAPIAMPAMAALPAMSALPQIPAALRALPPNAGAGDTPFAFTPGTRTNATVTAVITGPHPLALVDEGGTTRILTVGDRVDGEPIAAINATGIRLSGGQILAVERASEAGAPTPPPTLRSIPGGR